MSMMSSVESLQRMKRVIISVIERNIGKKQQFSPINLQFIYYQICKNEKIRNFSVLIHEK